ncbi:MAG: aminoacetone oxidase family FAD-binding enzyme [Lachnospiraceae bacterium]|nr:aminoacetone oxidase family FAD-binding enzyme [Lachnospiraceae bacterium]
MKNYDIIIIGAGASGLLAGICAARNGSDVLILEKLSKPGKKITVTGNGKCNIFSDREDVENIVNGRDKEAAARIFKSIPFDILVRFFESIGIFVLEKGGYYYPVSLQASTVRDNLVTVAASSGCSIICDCDVTDVKETNGGFVVNKDYSCKKLIMSAGGMARPDLGTDGSSFKLLKSLGVDHTELYPALCGLITDFKHLKVIDGVRHYADISLMVDGYEAFKEHGEIIFNKKGISGIPVMNCSGIAARALRRKLDVSIRIAVLTQRDREIMLKSIWERLVEGGYTIEELLTGIANRKLVYAMMLHMKVDPELRPGVDDGFRIAGHIIDTLCCLTLHVTGTMGFENAQVTNGGVRLDEVNNNTFEHKRVKNLYITGECLDADFVCGGNNLTFAWITGLRAGTYAAGGIIDSDICN